MPWRLTHIVRLGYGTAHNNTVLNKNAESAKKYLCKLRQHFQVETVLYDTVSVCALFIHVDQVYVQKDYRAEYHACHVIRTVTSFQAVLFVCLVLSSPLLPYSLSSHEAVEQATQQHDDLP